MPNETPQQSTADSIEGRYQELLKRNRLLEFVVLPLLSRNALTAAFIYKKGRKKAQLIQGEKILFIHDAKEHYPAQSVFNADCVEGLKIPRDSKDLLLVCSAAEVNSEAAKNRTIAPALWADLSTVINCMLVYPLLDNLALPDAAPMYFLQDHPNIERYLTQCLDNLQEVLLTEKRPRTLNCRSAPALIERLIGFCADELKRAGQECKNRKIKLSRGLTDPAHEAVKRVPRTRKKIVREPEVLSSKPAKIIADAATPEGRLRRLAITDSECRHGLYVALSGDPLAVPMLFALEERLHAAIRADYNTTHNGLNTIPTVDTTGVYNPKEGTFAITPAALFKAFAPDGITLPNHTSPERFIVDKCSTIHDTKITFRYIDEETGNARRVDDILFGFDRTVYEPEKHVIKFHHIRLVLLEPFIEAKNGKKDFTSIDCNIYHRLFAQHLQKEILTAATGVINYIMGYITPLEDHADALKNAGKVVPRTALEIPLRYFVGAESADAESGDKWPILPRNAKQKAAVIEAVAHAMAQDWIVTLIEEKGEYPKLRIEKAQKKSMAEIQAEAQENSKTGTSSATGEE